MALRYFGEPGINQLVNARVAEGASGVQTLGPVSTSANRIQMVNAVVAGARLPMTMAPTLAPVAAMTPAAVPGLTASAPAPAAPGLKSGGSGASSLTGGGGKAAAPADAPADAAPASKSSGSGFGVLLLGAGAVYFFTRRR